MNGCQFDGDDCDNTKSYIYPGATETCDGYDNNCDFQIDEGCDDDNDGYCDALMTFYNFPLAICPSSNLANGSLGDDCNDLDNAVKPGATEICGNGIDEDCSGADLSCVTDTAPPIVTAFDVQPRTTAGSITATWTVTDDQTLSQAELWRTDDSGGAPNPANWQQVQIQSVSGISASGSFSDTPSNGTWWYGLHVTDQSNNLGIEPVSIQVVKTSASPASKFFGSAYAIGSNQVAYESKFAGLFDQITPGNYGKWGVFEPTEDGYQYSNYDTMINFANTNGMQVKQHTFIWGQQQPAWISNYTTSIEVKAHVTDYMQEVMNRYPNIDMIDVVNEPLQAPPSYKNYLGGAGSTGYDWVVWAFQAARQVAPNAKLLLNEYNILNGIYLQSYVNLINILNNKGLIDGIGVQAHRLAQHGVSSSTIQNNLDVLAQFNLPIYISELDINLVDDTAQKNKYVSIFPTMWNHPMVKGVTLWGFWENRIWRQDAYLVRTDGSERPALTWLRNFLAQNPPTTCTSWTYSSWGTCQSNNTQTRTIVANFPTGCTGGNPTTSQSCTLFH